MVQIFQRRFGIVDQRHDDIAIARRVAASDQGIITVMDAGLDHRIARHFQRIMIAGAEQRRRHGKRAVAFQRLHR